MAELTRRDVKHDYHLQYQTFRQKTYNEEILFTVSTVQFQFLGLVFCRSYKCTPGSRSGSLAKSGTASEILQTDVKFGVTVDKCLTSQSPSTVASAFAWGG